MAASRSLEEEEHGAGESLSCVARCDDHCRGLALKGASCDQRTARLRRQMLRCDQSLAFDDLLGDAWWQPKTALPNAAVEASARPMTVSANLPRAHAPA